MSAAMEYTFFAMLLTGAATAQGNPNFEPGMWETRVTTQMPAVPMAIPPTSRRECLTRADLIPEAGRANASCNVVDHRFSSNTMRWHLRCIQEGAAIESNGTIIYSGDTFRGQVLSQVTGGAQGTIKMSQTLSGRRVGACP